MIKAIKIKSNNELVDKHYLACYNTAARTPLILLDNVSNYY